MGFSMSELHKLSLLVLGHRGKLRKLDVDFGDEAFIMQLLALRLAVVLCHARRDPDISGIQLTRDLIKINCFVLSFSVSWAQAFPQSAHLLREEVLAWQKTPWSLNVTETQSSVQTV
jgi:exopolyphosphatase/guanosine-5'-triphosphate,3'-diphosphate pyrophosphatase